ncbi:alpha/beta-hydrolase [Annulohypoxylon maeteangense]|uniref:alpha/beta-hydrolase n=1 Tax=Annulohypoxylon maeteangense TaxID=1927788 RepID=UPI002007AE31|nr:alpha/beta-hydrolase [Annulohypoxylon maeteangense]KAI0890401.1 alpha/beta-hydrolase [Annulohypoxylon maeteangense]
MAFPSVEEVSKSPAFPTAIWKLQPHRSGLLPVAASRGGPLNISWEVHGDGPIKLILIGGIGLTKADWQPQTLYFGHERGDRYSVLIFDNRGAGASDKPVLRYSTSEMARDLVEVLDHIGWTEERQLHVSGGSMGGMIAQELAVLAPQRIASLNLHSTAAKIEATGSFTEMTGRLGTLFPRSLESEIRATAKGCFPQSWLEGADEAEVPSAATPRCEVPKGGYGRFESNYARFAAQEICVGRGKNGVLLQAVAAGFHRKSPEQLRDLADRVGRGRIMVMHGVEDAMIPVDHGRTLVQYLMPGKALLVEGLGHAPIYQRTRWFNEVLEERCAVGERLSGR